MFKTLIFSFRKSRLLAKIAIESSNRTFNAVKIWDKAIKEITNGKTLDSREVNIERLLTLLGKDFHTCNLLKRYGRNFDDVRKIIRKLEISGGGEIVKGHYVAVSSIAFLKQLNVILEHWDGEDFRIGNLDNYNSNLKMASILLKSFE